MATIVKGDLKELELKLQNNEITQEEYDREFSEIRRHSIKKDVFPFAVGGSDAAIIEGVSKYKSPLGLYKEKMGASKKKTSKKQEDLFFNGHVFEEAFRRLFGRQSGLKVEPCTLQFGNTDYPHCVANIDGIVWENGIPGLYEGKTTSGGFTETWQEFESGIVPLAYYMQVQFYMEICNLDFAYIYCAKGFNDGEQKFIRVERDKEFGKNLCKNCEEFVENAAAGIAPDNRNVRNAEIFLKEASQKEVPNETPINLGSKGKSIFALIDQKAEEIKALEDQIKGPKKEIESLKKDIEKALCEFIPDLGEKTTGKVETDEAEYTVTFSNGGKYKLDAEVKKYWKENFPESYEKVNTLIPAERKISYKKKVKK